MCVLIRVQPDGGPGGKQPGSPNDPAWPWPGYKVLDIAAGAHFSLAIVINISGSGCTEDGGVTGHACVRQNVKNGLTEQDWDIPRNIDIIGDHFRKDVFQFDKAVTCGCKVRDPYVTAGTFLSPLKLLAECCTCCPPSAGTDMQRLFPFFVLS